MKLQREATRRLLSLIPRYRGDYRVQRIYWRAARRFARRAQGA